MKEHSPNPFADVMKHLNNKDLTIPVFKAEPVMARTDNLGVFEEGNRFSGIASQPDVQACVTIVASAHTPSTVSREAMVNAASSTFKRNSKLPPGVSELLPPQSIVWWTLKSEKLGNPNYSDFLELATMDQGIQEQFGVVIADRTHKATKLIEKVKGRSIIWGSWGNGNLDEKKETGRSRGVPTNKIGHSHVLHIDEARELLLPQNDVQPTVKDIINFADPWTHIVQDRFGDEIEKVLNTQLHDKKKDGATDITVTRQVPNQTDTESIVGGYHGYDIAFASEVPYTEVVATMINTAGTLESLYQLIVSSHEEYYRNIGSTKQKDEIRRGLREQLAVYGFNDDKALELTNFSFALKPTFTQLQRLKNEGVTDVDGLFTKYKKVSERMKDVDDSILGEIATDTYRPPEEAHLIGRTFPVHASAWYLCDNYTVGENEIRLKNFKIFPTLSSSMAATERIYGGVQKRPLSK